MRHLPSRCWTARCFDRAVDDAGGGRWADRLRRPRPIDITGAEFLDRRRRGGKRSRPGRQVCRSAGPGLCRLPVVWIIARTAGDGGGAYAVIKGGGGGRRARSRSGGEPWRVLRGVITVCVSRRRIRRFGRGYPADQLCRGQASPRHRRLTRFVGSDRLDALSIVAGGGGPLLIMSGGTRPELVRQALQAGGGGAVFSSPSRTVVSGRCWPRSARSAGRRHLTSTGVPQRRAHPAAGRPALGRRRFRLGRADAPARRDCGWSWFAQGLTHKQIGTRAASVEGPPSTHMCIGYGRKVGSVNKGPALTRVGDRSEAAARTEPPAFGARIAPNEVRLAR